MVEGHIRCADGDRGCGTGMTRPAGCGRMESFGRYLSGFVVFVVLLLIIRLLLTNPTHQADSLSLSVIF